MVISPLPSDELVIHIKMESVLLNFYIYIYILIDYVQYIAHYVNVSPKSAGLLPQHFICSESLEYAIFSIVCPSSISWAVLAPKKSHFCVILRSVQVHEWRLVNVLSSSNSSQIYLSGQTGWFSSLSPKHNMTYLCDGCSKKTWWHQLCLSCLYFTLIFEGLNAFLWFERNSAISIRCNYFKTYKVMSKGIGVKWRYIRNDSVSLQQYLQVISLLKHAVILYLFSFFSFHISISNTKKNSRSNHRL